MQELVKHWWNGRWGRLNRRNVRVYKDFDMWSVEALEGGDDGDSRWWNLPSEDLTLRLAADLMDDEDQKWLVVPSTLLR